MTTPDKAASLKRMKTLATALLVVVTLLFVVARREGWPWLAAFAEAAMIGALADWFAVVALFRHPLGLPIPHTAILPRNKARLADNLARFIRDRFLDTASLVARLRAQRAPDGTAYERLTADGPTALLPRGDRHYGLVHGVARDAACVLGHDAQLRQFVVGSHDGALELLQDRHRVVPDVTHGEPHLVEGATELEQGHGRERDEDAERHGRDQASDFTNGHARNSSRRPAG